LVTNIKINEKITALELRVIGEDGANLGVFKTSEALKLAKEKGLDLIEIAPTAKPPVAKIMSFDKYRYQEEKKLKKQKARQKTLGLKQVQITVRSAKHDLEIRANQVNKFLEEGYLVEIRLMLHGREKANKRWAMEKLENFLKIITPNHKIVMEPKFFGKGFSVQVSKK
jgi:translation initiation factor IF-3